MKITRSTRLGGHWSWWLGLTMLWLYSSSVAFARSLPDLTGLVEELKPVVVNIQTTKKGRAEHGTMPRNHPFKNNPFEEFFQPFLDRLPQAEKQTRNLGSGVIIDADGFILTNHHVIDGADEIKVRLTDEREFIAKVIGSDSKTDLALIQIPVKQKLNIARLGDSDALKVGAWVVAIGNPFGLEATVTAGIISAKGRSIGNGPYEDFLQTDAAINPGNSGGPLFDLDGHVIGINTAIFSRSGGYMGIGFAIPVNMAKGIVAQLKSSGQVKRGWLGIGIQLVTPELATALGLDAAKGALISQVHKNGPAADAGIKPGDVIIQFNGQEIHKMRGLPALVAMTPVGSKVPVVILRDGKERTLQVRIDEMPRDEASQASTPTAETASKTDPLGIKVASLNEEQRRKTRMGDDIRGVAVVQVDPDSPAGRSGLKNGDVIMDINRNPVENVRDYEQVMDKLGTTGNLLLRVARERGVLFIAINLEK
ncbi:MAG: DegQ family serine endoprotease [Magnetococcales bacterium]|nr:DegQ family serine endoprotease [Magnetococcales bacterium]NGZ05282.1 DegQ family serine endoprotease [Magnetococcales bacterium]